MSGGLNAVFDGELDALHVALAFNGELPKVEEEHLKPGVVANAVLDGHRKHVLAQSHRFRSKDTCIHEPRIAHYWHEVHVSKNIASDVDTRCDLDELHAFLREAKNTTLRDVK